MSQKPNSIYLCMYLYTYVYSACNREVVGSSRTKGWAIFQKQSFWALIVAHTHTHSYTYISNNVLGSVLDVCPCLYVYQETIQLQCRGNSCRIYLYALINFCICIYVYVYVYIYKQTYAHTIRILRASTKHQKWKQVPYILNTSRGIGTETCGMDNVFPPDDLWLG